jgi:hypothetical protein
LLATSVEGAVDLRHVRAVQLAMPGPTSPQALWFGRLEVVPGEPTLHAAYAGIVDQFGQSTRAQWPEKIASTAALRAAQATLARGRDAAPRMDAYGGRRPQLRGWPRIHVRRFAARHR